MTLNTSSTSTRQIEIPSSGSTSTVLMHSRACLPHALSNSLLWRAWVRRLKGLRCSPSGCWRLLCRSLLWWSLIVLLRNAVDEHGTPRCLGSWKTQCTWLRVRGRPRDAPDGVNGVRDDIVGGSLASPYPFVGATFLRASGGVCLQRQRETALHRRGLRHSSFEMNMEKTYEPPDGNFITIGAEHFRCAEVLLCQIPVVQCILFHCYRREGDCSECPEAVLHVFDYDTQLKSTAEIYQEKTCVLPDENILTVAPNVSVSRKRCRRTQCPSTEVTLCNTPSFVGLVVISHSVS